MLVFLRYCFIGPAAVFWWSLHASLLGSACTHARDRWRTANDDPNVA